MGWWAGGLIATPNTGTPTPTQAPTPPTPSTGILPGWVGSCWGGPRGAPEAPEKQGGGVPPPPSGTQTQPPVPIRLYVKKTKSNVKRLKVEREKKVGRENAFTSDFRIFHVSVSRFSLPAFFLSRSILGRFTFNVFLFHVRFSRFSRHVFGSFAAENVK